MSLMKKKDTLIINLIWWPGSGKSTTKVLKNLITKYNISYKEVDCYKAVEEIVKDIKNVY